MANDPKDLLDRYRRKPGEAAGARASSPGDLQPYEAHSIASQPAALAIYPALGPAHTPTYSYLFNVSWDDGIFETIVLFFTFMQVNIRGRNLAPLADALRLRKCEAIREFHAKEHLPPADGEPVITSIEIVVKDLPTALGEEMNGRDQR